MDGLTKSDPENIMMKNIYFYSIKYVKIIVSDDGDRFLTVQ